jgi:hypothetical protein
MRNLAEERSATTLLARQREARSIHTSLYLRIPVWRTNASIKVYGEADEDLRRLHITASNANRERAIGERMVVPVVKTKIGDQ